jgi:hypothetical protein
MKKQSNEDYDFNQYFLYCLMKKNYSTEYLNIGKSVGGWLYCGWISYKPVFSTFSKLVSSSLRTDHGEQRIVVPREDKRGVNCFYKQ